MKKSVSLILALILILGFSACGGGKKTEDTSASNTKATSEKTTESKSTVYEKGETKDGVWTSKSLGLKLTAGEDYTFMTDEELNQAMNRGSEILEGDENKVADAYEAAGDNVYYEFAVVNAASGANVNAFAEKTPYSNMTAKQYLKATKNTLAGMNATITYDDNETYTVSGVEFDCLSYHLEAQGVSADQLMLAKVVGDRVLVMTITYHSEDMLSEVIGLFSAVE